MHQIDGDYSFTYISDYYIFYIPLENKETWMSFGQEKFYWSTYGRVTESIDSKSILIN